MFIVGMNHTRGIEVGSSILRKWLCAVHFEHFLSYTTYMCGEQQQPEGET